VNAARRMLSPVATVFVIVATLGFAPHLAGADNAVRLTNDSAIDYEPWFSPDGTMSSSIPSAGPGTSAGPTSG